MGGAFPESWPATRNASYVLLGKGGNVIRVLWISVCVFLTFGIHTKLCAGQAPPSGIRITCDAGKALDADPARAAKQQPSRVKLGTPITFNLDSFGPVTVPSSYSITLTVNGVPTPLANPWATITQKLDKKGMPIPNEFFMNPPPTFVTGGYAVGTILEYTVTFSVGIWTTTSVFRVLITK